jgi:hypothetical protein
LEGNPEESFIKPEKNQKQEGNEKNLLIVRKKKEERE